LKEVLVVDDNEQNLYYLEVLLGANGYHTVRAKNGNEALSKARSTQPDLVISDLLMPEMDGYSLLRSWRQDEQLQTIPFLVYTGTYTETEDEELAFSLGADAFLTKPCEPEQLIAALRKIEEANKVATKPSRDIELAQLDRHSQILVRKLSKKYQELEVQRLQLLEEARQRESMLKTQESILNGLPARIALLDRDGVILSVNDAWLQFARQSGFVGDSGGVGSNYLEVARRAEDEEQEIYDLGVSSGIRQVIERKASGFTRDYPCHASSQRHWFRMVVSPLHTDCGEGAVVMHLDITEQKEFELQALRDQRLESIGTLAGGIAHDLNNTLQPILMSVELLKMDEADPDRQELIRTIENSARRGADLVRQVLLFARGGEVARAVVDLRTVVWEMSRLVTESFPKAIHFEASVADEPMLVMGDRTQLHQVLLNLCVNARDAMPHGGTLRVLLEMGDEADCQIWDGASLLNRSFLRLQVADTGSGIAPQVLDKIFTPFFTTKDVGKGSGLGLSTSLTIVERHGGTMSVASEQGVGTTVRVFLPRYLGDSA